MKYSIGHLMMPSKDDKQFDSLEDAEVKALEESFDDGIWAVWDNEYGELLSIVYQQEVFGK